MEVPGGSSNLTSSPSQDDLSADNLSEDDLSNSSLNLSSNFISVENYITIKEGCNAAFTVDELQVAVERCKKLVLESEQCSNERKWLVRRLIELRLRLECATDHKENKNDDFSDEPHVRLGHYLKFEAPPNPFKRQLSCDHCTCSIWNLVANYYKCIYCHYKCHVDCIQLVRRPCPILSLSENPRYLDQICPEVGLDKQAYSCAECKRETSIVNIPRGYFGIRLSESASMVEARRCSYDGKYYCRCCHWRTMSIIPARVVHNWDFEPQPVCQASYRLIKMSRDRPMITLDEKLYGMIAELAAVQKKREDLSHMKQYIAMCRFAKETMLLKDLDWRNHLIHSKDTFSLNDLVDLKNGTLLPKIEAVYNQFMTHIKTDCEVCKGRAYICLACGEGNAIFPFDPDVYICPRCNHVQHKHCWLSSKTCPKCVRRAEAVTAEL